MDIIDHKHKFKIGDEEIELIINRKGNLWTSDVIKGRTGVGYSSGGNYETVEEYAESMEIIHKYTHAQIQKEKEARSKLSACPFCDDNDLIISEIPSPDTSIIWYKIHHIYSDECSVSMIDPNKDTLIIKWNIRPLSSH